MGKDKENPIKVYARVRPLTKKEIGRDEDMAVETFHDVRKIKIIDRKHCYESTYNFDRVFAATDTNETVFTYTTKNFLTKLLNGTNCTLIAYGQTGSGKTYTLMANGGVTDYTISHLFHLIEEDKLHTYKVTCSFVQIYLEKVFDILSPHSKRELSVREHPTRGIHVQDLTEHTVSNAKDVFHLFHRGKRELIRAETEMVHLSSRSHSIFQICFQRTVDISKLDLLMKESESECIESEMLKNIPQGVIMLDKGMVVGGKIDICDLAGSERFGKTLVESTNQNEARYINASLLQLGNVIYALSDRKQRHIPFRNSTLTRLLQECLGCECVTTFIICVSPSCSEAHETRCSLNFGSRARTITSEGKKFTGAVDHKLLAKKLSTKIYLLEKELHKSPRIRTTFCNNHTQTDLQKNGHTNNIKTYIDITKHSLELSGLLDLFVEGKNNQEDLCDEYNRDNEFDRYNKHEEDNECEADYGYYMDNEHDRDCKYEHDCNNENENDNEYNGDTKNVGESKYEDVNSNNNAKLMSTTTRILRIIMTLQHQLEIEHCGKVVNILEQCRRKMKIFHEKIVNVKNCIYKTLVEQASFTISYLCYDIRTNVCDILKRINDVRLMAQSIDNTVAAHAWYTNMDNCLNTLGEEKISLLDASSILSIYYLVYLLQLLQIVRLSLTCKTNISACHQSTFLVKPLICSTSLEDQTISPTTSRETIQDFYKICAIKSSQKHRVVKKNRKTKPNSIHGDKEQRGGEKTYVCKLNRQPEIKIKQCAFPMKNQFAGTNYKKSSMYKSNEIFCNKNNLNTPKTGVKDKLNKAYLPPSSRKLFNMFHEIQKKYDEAVIENNELRSNVKRLENEHAMIIKRLHFQERLKTCYTVNKNKEDELSRIKDECSRYKIIEGNSKVLLTRSTEEILRLKSVIEEKDKLMVKLESEKDELNEKREENIIKNNEMQELRDDIKLFQKIFESCISLSEEVLSLSEAVVEIKIQHGQRKFEDIKGLEVELFRLLECNLRYENIIHDIRYKVNQSVVDVVDLRCKTKHSPTDVCNIKDSSKEEEKDKLLNTNMPWTKIECNTKLTEILSGGDGMIQNLLIGDLHNSPYKNYLNLKDIKMCLLIKELLREKLKLDAEVKKIKCILKQKEIKISQNKCKIDLFVKQLGQLDQELNGGVQYSGFISPRCYDEIEVVAIPGMNYNKFTVFLNYFSNGIPASKAKFAYYEPDTEVQMILVEELDELKSEINYYKRKRKEIECQYNNLNNCLEEDLESTNNSLLCKIEYLKHVNTIIEKENRKLKKKNIEQKNQMKMLRDENSRICEQVDMCRCQSMQTKAKNDIAKLQLEKKLSKCQEKLVYLEKFIDVMNDKTQAEKRRERKCFDDSGLPQDDSDSPS